MNVSEMFPYMLHKFCRMCYSQTEKTVDISDISGMLLCCKEQANQAWEN